MRRNGSGGDLEVFTTRWKLYYNACINSFIFAIDGGLHKPGEWTISCQSQWLGKNRPAVSAIPYNFPMFIIL